MKIAVLDYGMGNLHSVAKALEHVGAEVIVTNDPHKIDSADKLLFPGVGAMRDCMQGMRDAGIDETVKRNVFNKPTMAICVGMQALFTTAEENEGVDCLDILQGQVVRFTEGLTDHDHKPIKIPHMGWNSVQQTTPEHPLWEGITDKERFYFVHSFYCQPTDSTLVSATCDYGVDFTASVLKENLFATQFHPEKSHNAGLKLLKNFVEWQI